ncbi:MAG: serine/threonine protein kinase [Deltaproteobacteria bacterium]|nr:serine/threonine protein kinase [Deltaproteobacteria bacterium]
MTVKLKIGDTLEGKYLIRKQIGEGGMGVVYEGIHMDLEMKVAIKVLHPIEADDPSMIDRFKIEAKSSASIKHQNVVEVSDFGLTPDGRPFFVMEYLEGESLADLLDRKRVLKQSQTVEIVDQILSGLERAHKRNIIHRDLKPENIFLAKTESGQRIVKVLDFGIAKIAKERADTIILNNANLSVNGRRKSSGRFKTEHGVVMGTPGYMAPETLTGRQEADTRADLFAVGVLLFEMLTGMQPFRGENPQEIMLNTATKPVPDPQKINPSISNEMAKLCLIALAKEPDDRFQSADEFITYLTAAAVGHMPQHGRECKTDVGVPSFMPSPITGSDSFNVDVNNFDTASLRPKARPVAQYSSPPSKGKSRERVTPYDISNSNPYSTYKKGGAGSPYVGPPRTKRLRVHFQWFPIFLFLGLIAGAGYLIKTSALFSVPVENNSTDDNNFNIYNSNTERKIEKGYKQAASTITIWVDVTPENSTILWNGELAEDRPLHVKSSKLPAKVEIIHPGYDRKVLVITPDFEQTIHAALKKSGKKKKF